MLALSPRRVEFAGEGWDHVTAVTVDRTGKSTLIEWGDNGPHVVLVDVPEQRVTVRVVQEMLGDDIDGPRPGAMGVLVFVTSPTSTDTARREVRLASAVVTGVEYQVSMKRGAVRTVTLVGVSSNGTTDPVAVTGS